MMIRAIIGGLVFLARYCLLSTPEYGAEYGVIPDRPTVCSKEISLQLPWPPSLNHYWRCVVIRGNARPLISAEGRRYRQAVAAAVLAQGLTMRRLDKRLVVSMVAYPPDKRERDLDNLPKALFDALTSAEVWLDDKQIDRFTVKRGQVIKGGLVRLIINEA